MDYTTLESQIARAIHIIGFPSHHYPLEKRLGNSYEKVSYDGVLNEYIAQAQKIKTYPGERDTEISNAIYDAEITKDKQLISDLGEKVLKKYPQIAYRAAKSAGNEDLEIRAENLLLRKNLNKAYEAVTTISYKIIDKDFLCRIFDEAIKRDLECALLIVGRHQYEENWSFRLDNINRNFLSTQPNMVYHLAKRAGNHKLLTTARQSWINKDHVKAFKYGTNGMEDEELARLAILHSSEGIESKDLYHFVVSYMPERQDLLEEARQHYASEDPDGAFLTGTWPSEDKIDEFKDKKLIDIALSNPNFSKDILAKSATGPNKGNSRINFAIDIFMKDLKKAIAKSS